MLILKTCLNLDLNVSFKKHSFLFQSLINPFVLIHYIQTLSNIIDNNLYHRLPYLENF
jgi:hypothetical protein